VVSSIATVGIPDGPVELLVHDGRLSGARGAAGLLDLAVYAEARWENVIGAIVGATLLGSSDPSALV
jgi:hypothetical protein